MPPVDSSPLHLTREYHGISPPPGAQLPTPAELFHICPSDYPNWFNRGFAYPPEKPIFWIKHGHSILWNELSAQTMAHWELQNLKSSVRAPALYYACELRYPQAPWRKDSYGRRRYIVMEYVPGKTTAEWLEETNDDTQRRDLIYARIGLALSELLRIPVPPKQPPSGIDGGVIWHTLFEDCCAPLPYESVEELETHINKVKAQPLNSYHRPRSSVVSI